MSTPIENLKDQQSVSPLGNNVRQKKRLFVQSHPQYDTQRLFGKYRRYMGRVLGGENEVCPTTAVRAGEPCLGRRLRSARRALGRRPADERAGSERTTEFGP
jgi:hypothetical protein